MTYPLPNPENTTAIVVTYHPDADTCQRLRQIRKVVDQVIIIDNHSHHDSIKDIQQLASQDQAIIFQQMSENVGVASALNCGVLKAILNDKKFALLFDQDSTPPDDMLGRLRQHLEELSETAREKAGIVAVNYSDGSNKSALPVTPGLSKTRAAITSGSLLNLSLFEQTGRFQDDYFIDEVDHEYCLKLRKNGFDVLIAADIILKHGLGQMKRVNLPGFKPGVSNHSSTRRYYMARNRVTLAKTYLTFDPVFVITRLALLGYESVLVILFEDQKSQKLIGTLTGLWHGIKGQSGPAPGTPRN